MHGSRRKTSRGVQLRRDRSHPELTRDAHHSLSPQPRRPHPPSGANLIVPPAAEADLSRRVELDSAGRRYRLHLVSQAAVRLQFDTDLLADDAPVSPALRTPLPAYARIAIRDSARQNAMGVNSLESG